MLWWVTHSSFNSSRVSPCSNHAILHLNALRNDGEYLSNLSDAGCNVKTFGTSGDQIFRTDQDHSPGQFSNHCIDRGGNHYFHNDWDHNPGHLVFKPVYSQDVSRLVKSRPKSSILLSMNCLGHTEQSCTPMVDDLGHTEELACLGQTNQVVSPMVVQNKDKNMKVFNRKFQNQEAGDHKKFFVPEPMFVWV